MKLTGRLSRAIARMSYAAEGDEPQAEEYVYELVAAVMKDAATRRLVENWLAGHGDDSVDMSADVPEGSQL